MTHLFICCVVLIGSLEPPDQERQVAQFLLATESTKRWQAERGQHLALLRSVNPRFTPKLIGALHTDNSAIRRRIAEGIAQIGEAALPALIRTATDSASSNERMGAIDAIARIRKRPDRCVPCLTRIVVNDTGVVRKAAVQALASFGKSAASAQHALMDATSSTDRGTVLEALRTLASVGRIENCRRLVPMLAGNDRTKGRLAAEVIRNSIGSQPDVHELIIPLLLNKRRDLQLNALKAAGGIRSMPQSVLKQITALLDASDHSVRVAAFDVLKNAVTKDDAIQLMVSLRHQRDFVIRGMAEQTLRKLSPERAKKLFGPPYDTDKQLADSNKLLQVQAWDHPQLAGSGHRNNVTSGVRLPESWDVGSFDRARKVWTTGENVKWHAKLGSQSYGGVAIANGKLFKGTNNGAGYIPRYPATHDLGCMLCFDEATGKFLWQFSSEKLIEGRALDWPLQGICSTPLIEGERLWFVSNRGEVICADTEGFRDGEDDGEQGVWHRNFIAMVNLKKIDTHQRHIYVRTLTSVIQSIFPELTGRLIFRNGPNPNDFDVFLPTQKSRVAAVRRTPKHIELQRILLDGKSVSRMPYDLSTGLSNGTVSPALLQLLGLDSKQRHVVEKGANEKQIWFVKQGDEVTRLRLRGAIMIGERRVEDNLKLEADVVWRFDMMNQLGVRQHNMAACSPAIWKDTIFVSTSNGVNESHTKLDAPTAASFIALDKTTGKLLWQDNSPGRNVLHGQWASPAVGILAGIPQVIFPGGDGWLYSFRADKHRNGKPIPLWKYDCNPKESKWTLGGRGTRNNIIAAPVIYDGAVYVVVGQDPEHGEGAGRLICINPGRRGDVSAELVLDSHGNPQAHRRLQAVSDGRWKSVGTVEAALGIDDQLAFQLDVLKRLETLGIRWPDAKFSEVTAGRIWYVDNPKDPLQRLRITLRSTKIRGTWKVEREVGEFLRPNPNSAEIWTFVGYDFDRDGKLEFEETMHRSLASPVIKNNMLVIPDYSGLVHCLNAKTGTPYWSCDLLAPSWSTALIVNETILIGDEDGDIAILPLTPNIDQFVEGTAALRTAKKEINLDNSIYGPPIFANNRLYLATRNVLFAIEAPPEPTATRQEKE